MSVFRGRNKATTEFFSNTQTYKYRKSTHTHTMAFLRIFAFAQTRRHHQVESLFYDHRARFVCFYVYKMSMELEINYGRYVSCDLVLMMTKYWLLPTYVHYYFIYTCEYYYFFNVYNLHFYVVI